MNNPETTTEIKMDVDTRPRAETYTAPQVGPQRRLVPVTLAGDVDENRPVQYVGSTQVLTAAGPLPLSFDIEADTLGEAAEKFGDAARQAFENTMEELKEMQRQQASQIVVPKGGMDPMGGMGGGGNIQMP